MGVTSKNKAENKRRIDFVVCGVPRSGTNYISAVMNKLGCECGHEDWLQKDSWCTERETDDVWGDVNWHCAPYLYELPKDIPVVLIVRHPVNVINSLLATGDYKRWRNALRKEDEGYFFFNCKTKEEEANWFWRCWNNLILSRSSIVLPIDRPEELKSNLAILLYILGKNKTYASKVSKVVDSTKKLHSRGPHPEIVTWWRLEKETRKLARELGYGRVLD